MKRKIFSTLLFGALAFVSLSTVTSCKDYDDDINNLQGQIDKMALKTDVDALKSQLEATKSTAESALAKANANESEIAKVKATAEQAGKDVADAVKAAAEAKSSAADAAAAAKKAQETADAAVKAAADNSKTLEEIGKWQATVVTTDVLAKEMDDLLEKINKATEEQVKELTKIVKAFDGSINALYSAVTEVSLVGSFTTENGGYKFETGTADLTVSAGQVARNYEFGKEEKDDLDGKHSATPTKKYTQWAQFGFTDDFLIRVNPVNATITADMIKFIDSKGNDLNNLFEITKVEKFDELLTRGANATGLWKVSAKPKKNVADTNKGVAKDGKKIVYAVAINNTAAQAEAVEDAANRYVVSTYDLTFNAVNWTAPANLHPVKVYSETTMGKDAAKALNEIRGRENIDGQAYIIPAKSGENVVLDFSALADKAEWFYVVRDDKHAGESDASEINAWNKYEYAGLNQVYSAKEGGKISVTIPADAVAGDEIAFRVFAVDYAGNLIENGHSDKKDRGHSFMVYVAAQKTATVTGDILALAANKAETGWLPLAGTLSDGANVENIAGGITGLTLKVNDNESWTVDVKFAKNADGTGTPSKNSEIKYAKFTSTQTMTSWTDGATATKTVEIKDTYRQTIASILNISLTKKLPDLAYTKANHKLSWKGEQLKNGVFTAYLFTINDGKNWKRDAGATTGYKELDDVLNGFKGTQYEYVIEGAEMCTGSHWHADGKLFFDNALTTKGSNSVMKVSNAKDAAGTLLIDNATEHASKLQYNYGLISSVKVNNNFVDYCIAVEEFKTVFACPLNTEAQKYEWKQWTKTDADGNVTKKDVNVLTWGSDATVEGVEIGDYIVGKNSFDNSKFGGVFNKPTTGDGCCMLYPNNWGDGDGQNKAELLTNSNGEADYFAVTYTSGKLVFTHKNIAANPTADVPSTLKLTLYDAFGHKNVYELPFTVKRAE